MTMNQKVKDILDRECFEEWHAKECQDRTKFIKKSGYNPCGCFLCHRHDALTDEIVEAMRLECP